jgi:hypothetical protein
MVPRAGLEPAQSFDHEILSLARIPISPPRPIFSSLYQLSVNATVKVRTPVWSNVGGLREVSKTANITERRNQTVCPTPIRKTLFSEQFFMTASSPTIHENPPHPNPPPRGGRARVGVTKLFSN